MPNPLKIKAPPRAKGKFEAECHFPNCNWSFFKWKYDDAAAILLDHLDGHINPPPEFERRAEDMPGYGAGCNV